MEVEMEALTLQEEKLINTNEGRAYNYDVLTKEQIAQEMERIITEASAIINLPRNDIAALLHCFKWDKMTLMERYYTENRDQLLSKAGIYFAHRECQICNRRLPSRQIYIPSCSHEICFDCWFRHLRKENKSKIYRCRYEDCDVVLEKKIAIRLMKGSEEYHRITQTNSFIKSNSLMKRCPTRFCSNVFRVEQIDARPVRCLCGRTICMECGEDWHSPVNCRLLKRWLEMMATEGKTIMKLANATKCPKCKMELVKVPNTTNAICSHCTSSFCWYCFQPWNEQWVCCAIRQNRVGFFVQSYTNHKESFHEESKLLDFIENKKYKMLQMATQNTAKIWLDRNLWDKALEVLLACRKLLTYSYVFGYFLEENNQCRIFQDNQRDLDIATENLSKCIKQFNYDTVYEDLEKAIHFSNYCDNRRKVLLDHLVEGDRKRWWNLK